MNRTKDELLLECIKQFEHIENVLGCNRLSTTRSLIDEINQALTIHAVSGRSEQFSCPLPDARCDRHKIDDEEGRWEFCNTCKREWAR